MAGRALKGLPREEVESAALALFGVRIAVGLVGQAEVGLGELSY